MSGAIGKGGATLVRSVFCYSWQRGFVGSVGKQVLSCTNGVLVEVGGTKAGGPVGHAGGSEGRTSGLEDDGWIIVGDAASTDGYGRRRGGCSGAAGLARLFSLLAILLWRFRLRCCAV